MKYAHLYSLLLMLFFYSSSQGQDTTRLAAGNTKSQTKDVITYSGPKTITRNIIQDRKGNMWVAAFDGIFRYDGKSFTNITSKVSSARFCSILEDRKGAFWFGSIGSGVYYYDGKSFQNFTTQNGLINNEITCIYEDKGGNIWFGANGGVSQYNGKSFRNYVIKGDSMIENRTWSPVPNLQRPPNEVNAIIEDQEGKFWFATRGNTFVYDGKTFTVVTNNSIPFNNVRSITEDKKGNIWLGGAGGLWSYKGRTFTSFTKDFVGYVYEDKRGNIWTSSQTGGGWAISRYDERLLSHKMLTATQIRLEYKGNAGMIFGILEASDGTIWFGALRGVYRYDGKTIKDFKDEEG
jgi:ligand-binding sensor domain-containing protein